MNKETQYAAVAALAGVIVFMAVKKSKAGAVTGDGGTTGDNAGIDSLIEQAAGKAAIDPALLRAIVQVESGGRVNAFNPEDKSRDAYQPGTIHDTNGSFGLAQVRGKTAKALKKSYPWLPALKEPIGQSLLVPAVNLAYAAQLIAELQRHLATSDIRAIAVGYNGGEKAAKSYMRTGTASNTGYADKVESNYA